MNVILFTLLMVAIVLPSCSSEASPVWVLDPTDPGSDQPPTGRSLFDYLVTEEQSGKTRYIVPFPFSDLVRKIEQQVGTGDSQLPRVLIPLNRSLQRNAAKLDFFKYPRAVMGVNTEGRGGLFLKDRLFLGYQEKAGIIEVISYNEAAGRFEFQVVKDYRPGGNPVVVYANRMLCTVCHQNQGPIFARPLWDETNANPKIASLLEAQGREFYQFPSHVGIDIPNALDEATDRANQLSAYQLFWQDGCAFVACRADLFRLVLQYRLTGGNAFSPQFIKRWNEKWPKGLLIPNPDIMNRNPLDKTSIRSLFDPSLLRAPIATWLPSAENVSRVIRGLSQFLAEADIKRLDAHLFQRGSSSIKYDAVCQNDVRKDERLTFQCRGSGFSMDGVIYLKSSKVVTGTIDHLSFGEHDELTDLEVVSGEATFDQQGGCDPCELKGRLRLAQKHTRLNARRADGNAIKEITFRKNMARVTVTDDFSAIVNAIDAMAHEKGDAFVRKPFRRVGVMKPLFEHLGMPVITWCCLDDKNMPEAVLDVHSHGSESVPAIKAFHQYCAGCHHGEDGFPPNFLHGSATQVRANLSHCAERIFFRLNMWKLPLSNRPETPMPPMTALRKLHLSSEKIYDSPDLRMMERYVAESLKSSGGRLPHLRDYDSLRDCLPQRSTH